MADHSFCFILYKPAVPGNIGAAARAMKTMGFTELRLVDPANHLADEARMMAHGSLDILENSKVYPTYEAAVADIDFIVCTTAKKKSAKVDYIPSGRLQAFLAEKIPVTRRIGIVFGTEESGLPNSILLHANSGVTIPMATSHPSLNLAQSVMVIAYELSGLLRSTSMGNAGMQGTGIEPTHGEHSHFPGIPQYSGGEKSSADRERSTFETEHAPLEGERQLPETWQQLQERTSVILNKSGIRTGTPLYHRIIERMSFLKASDARLAHSVTSKVIKLLGQSAGK